MRRTPHAFWVTLAALFFFPRNGSVDVEKEIQTRLTENTMSTGRGWTRCGLVECWMLFLWRRARTTPATLGLEFAIRKTWLPLTLPHSIRPKRPARFFVVNCGVRMVWFQIEWKAHNYSLLKTPHYSEALSHGVLLFLEEARKDTEYSGRYISCSWVYRHTIKKLKCNI